MNFKKFEFFKANSGAGGQNHTRPHPRAVQQQITAQVTPSAPCKQF
jgi:hypothetical protein